MSKEEKVVELIRKFWHFISEKKIKGSDIAVYFYIIEKSRRKNFENPIVINKLKDCPFSDATYYRSINNLKKLKLIDYNRNNKNKEIKILNIPDKMAKKQEKNIKPAVENIKEFCKQYFANKYIVNPATEKALIVLVKNYKEETIKKAIKNAKKDNFWSKNFLSPAKLNKTNKAGEKYIDVFLTIKDEKIDSNFENENEIKNLLKNY